MERSGHFECTSVRTAWNFERSKFPPKFPPRNFENGLYGVAEADFRLKVPKNAFLWAVHFEYHGTRFGLEPAENPQGTTGALPTSCDSP